MLLQPLILPSSVLFFFHVHY